MFVVRLLRVEGVSPHLHRAVQHVRRGGAPAGVRSRLAMLQRPLHLRMVQGQSEGVEQVDGGCSSCRAGQYARQHRGCVAPVDVCTAGALYMPVVVKSVS